MHNDPLQLVLSPYELSGRTIGSSLALMLGEPVVTLLPSPVEGGIADLAPNIPEFGRLLETWAWTLPLWSSDVLVDSASGERVRDEMARIAQRIQREPAFRPVHRSLDPSIFEQDTRYLRAVCRDLIKAGAAPGISIPVNTAMESLASRHRLAMIRTPSPSTSGRLERRMERRLARFTLPTLEGADGQTILELRAALERELGRVRQSLRYALDSCDADAPPSVNELVESELSPHCDELEHRLREEIQSEGLDPGPQARPVLCGVSICLIPVGVTLRSAQGAAGMLRPGRAPKAGVQNSDDLLALPDNLALIIRRLPWSAR